MIEVVPDTFIWGDWVQFILPDGDILKCPDECQLMYFPDDPVLRRCDFYIARAESIGGGDEAKRSRLLSKRVQSDPDGIREGRIGSERSLSDARNHYGNSARLGSFSVDIPTGGWERIATVHAICCRIKGKKRGLYTHLYDSPQPLYGFAPRPGFAWKVKLPEGCVIDDWMRWP